MYRFYVGMILCLVLAMGGCDEYEDEVVDAEFAQLQDEVQDPKPIVMCISECKREYRDCLQSGVPEAQCARERTQCIGFCSEEEVLIPGDGAEEHFYSNSGWCPPHKACGRQCCNSRASQHCCEPGICSRRIGSQEVCL